MMRDKGRLSDVGLGTNFLRVTRALNADAAFLMSQEHKRAAQRGHASLIFHLHISENGKKKRKVDSLNFLK